MISIEFFGAAKTVTGSNYLVKTDNFTFVVDCGMFQGEDVEHINLEDFEYDPSQVDFALLTHAHIDHCGALPKLVRHGFEGSIYATYNTIQLCTELLMDSAKLQENAYTKGEFFGKYTQIKGMMYNTKDAISTIEKFRSIDYLEEFYPVEGIKVRFFRAGHILGAASIEVKIQDEGKEKTIIFSGDIGRVQSPLIETFDNTFDSDPDYVLMESLYGGEYHADRTKSANDLVEIINDVTKNNGNVFIPCFAVQRTQEVLNDLKHAKESGHLDNETPVWLDSPLAQRVTKIYSQALDDRNSGLFNFKNLIYVRKYKQSVKLASKQGNVIIAGSGMADGGRIMGHLTTGLSSSKNAVVFVGFQAEGTLGRQLVEGAKKVTIGTKTINVKAKIHHLEGFSAHGDTGDYVAWLNKFKSDNLKKVILIHAEEERSIAMKSKLEELGFDNCHIPALKEKLTI